MSNPFNDTLDWALRGKYARVHTDIGVFEGGRLRSPQPGSVVVHDATNTTTEELLRSVFIRVCEIIEVLTRKKRIEFISLENLSLRTPSMTSTSDRKTRVSTGVTEISSPGVSPWFEKTGRPSTTTSEL
jgi:hypothetical protein